MAKFEVVEASPTPATQVPAEVAKPTEAEQASKFLMSAFASMLSIQALAQRATVAAAKMFPLITAFLVFAVWMNGPTDPNTHQLVGLGLFASFVLVINAIVLWRK